MIKLVALDLDDTLLDSELKISPETARAVSAAVEQGVTVTLATGRMYSSARPYALELGLDVPLITYQGALVKTSRSQEVLYHSPVPLELAREMIGYLFSRGFDVNLYMEDQLYAQAGNRWVEEYRKIARVPCQTVPDLLASLTTAPDKFLVIDEEPQLDRLASVLRQMVGDKLHITKSKPFFLEFTHPEADKAKALAHLAARLGIAREEVMAVGDSYNDLEMLEYAGTGIAMGNARPEIKAKADYVTLGNDAHGVAEAIYRFVLGDSFRPQPAI